MPQRLRLVSFPLLLLFWNSLIPVAKADEWSKQWSVSGKPELHVTAGDASIAIETGSNSQIEAVLRTRGISIGPSGIKVTERQSGNRVELEIREPSSGFNFGMRSIELKIRVPRELTADIHTGDGSVSLHGLHGAIHASTGDGSIETEGLDGSLDLHSGDGSLRIRGRFDALQLRTSDGSVTVDAAPGSHLNSSWRIETGDGSVHLGVPNDLAANLELRTGDGSIHVGLPLSVDGIKNEHEVRGKLNGGGGILEVHTGDGSINVSESSKW